MTTFVPTATLPPSRLEPLIGRERVERLERTAADVRERLGNRRILNVSSTAVGGGVAEMLHVLLAYVRGADIDARWVVIEGDPAFFAITKRIHNGLYGGPGDGGELGPDERNTYERTLERNLRGIRDAVRPGDTVIVHDPQPAGLVPALLETGAIVIWRCHVGLDETNIWAERAWRFVQPYVEGSHAFVFSRREFVPPWIEPAQLHVIPPSIDPFTPKNEHLHPATVLEYLDAAGIVSSPVQVERAPIARPADVVREGAPPDTSVPLVVQVSRWDRMKDMTGVLRGFVEYVEHPDARLVLAGPGLAGVTDDPEDRGIWEETVALWRTLEPQDRARVLIAGVPMVDPVENALVINALQRHAAIVVQKSLAEGFGLTVAEAMWKGRPVVASAVGGIVDQVVDGETGLLVRDPLDLDAFGRLVQGLLEAPEEADRLAENGRQRVLERFLPDRQLLQYATLLEGVLGPNTV